MLTIDGSAVAWPELRFWIRFIGKAYEQTHGLARITRWDVRQNGQPLRDFLLATAVNYAREDRAIEVQARRLGVTLTDADQQALAQAHAQGVRTYGSESEYRHIVAAMYGSEAMYDYLSKMDRLGANLFAQLYGADGSGCSDDCVSAYARQHGLTATNPDAPLGDSGHTLRYQSAYDSLFKPQVQAWTATQKVRYRDAFRHIDLTALFR